MNISNKIITISKTARCCVFGKSEKGLKSLWILCHGYGQLAEKFLKNFIELYEYGSILIAPEGLHRFYLEGFSGRIGASWMTKEDRLNDIKDNNNYLEQVYLKYKDELAPGGSVNILGFSQGAATVCRWISENNLKVDKLVLYAGVFPSDIEKDLSKNIFRQTSIYLIKGSNDEFINEFSWQKQLNLFKEYGIKPEVLTFEGGHSINREIIKKIK